MFNHTFAPSVAPSAAAAPSAVYDPKRYEIFKGLFALYLVLSIPISTAYILKKKGLDDRVNVLFCLASLFITALPLRPIASQLDPSLYEHERGDHSLYMAGLGVSLYLVVLGALLALSKVYMPGAWARPSSPSLLQEALLNSSSMYSSREQGSMTNSDQISNAL